MGGLAGRRVVVMGASGALGGGLAAEFVAAGADVIGVVRSEPSGPVEGVRYERADVADDQSLAELFARVGTPWAVVNTVGGYAPHRPLAELDLDELNRQLVLNLTTAAAITKHALRAMQPSGEGRIIHTSSRAATVTAGSGFAYSVSKAGVLHLVQMAAADVAGSGITVNAVSPSIIDTPANRSAMPGADFDSWPKVPEIARAYLFLASPEALRVNGSVLAV